MIRRPPRSTLSSSSAASDVYKRQGHQYAGDERGGGHPPNRGRRTRRGGDPLLHLQPPGPPAGRRHQWCSGLRQQGRVRPGRIEAHLGRAGDHRVPAHLTLAVLLPNGTQGESQVSGIEPRTVDPEPGVDSHRTEPPMAPRRSLMFMNPCPAWATSGSNPGPSSLTAKRRPPSSSHTRSCTWASGACLAAFCSASRQQKYTAASTAAEKRPIPSTDASTSRGLLDATARRASGSPLSISSGG